MVRALSLLLIICNIRLGLFELLSGGTAGMSFGMLVLTLAVSCVHVILLLLEIIMIAAKKHD
jgi:hypothetical protein